MVIHGETRLAGMTGLALPFPWPIDAGEQLGKRQFEAGQNFASPERIVRTDIRPLMHRRVGPRVRVLGSMYHTSRTPALK